MQTVVGQSSLFNVAHQAEDIVKNTIHNSKCDLNYRGGGSMNIEPSHIWMEMYKIALQINYDRFDGVVSKSEDTVRLLELLDKTMPEEAIA